MLEDAGAVVIYADLWKDRDRTPSDLVLAEVKNALTELSKGGSAVLQRIQRLKGLNLGALGFSFGFQIDKVGTPEGASLADVFVELVNKARTDVVLIVDEVQQATNSEDSSKLMHALKAARDAVNTAPNTPGHFLFVGTGSYKSVIVDMASRRTQPFAGAVAADYEVLGQDYVDWELQRIRASDATAILPSPNTSFAGFQTLGCRPEEFLKALRQLQHTALAADGAFLLICQVLANEAADRELLPLEELGPLPRAVFDRIAAGPEAGISGLFGAASLEQLGLVMGEKVDASQVQIATDRLVTENLIARPAHGIYRVTDPFVRANWNARHGRKALPRE